MSRKGVRQREHSRLVWTRKGRKSIKINPGLHKHKVLRRLVRKGAFIGPNQKDVFDYVSYRTRETGGYLDFKKNGELENATMIFGDDEGVDIPSGDFEVEWHTHGPSKSESLNKMNYFPSKDDIKGFLFESSPQQTMIIFHRGSKIMLTKTGKTRSMLRFSSKKKINKYIDEVEEKISDFAKLPEKEFLKKLPDFKAHTNKLGLKFNYVNPEEQKIEIPVGVIE